MGPRKEECASCYYFVSGAERIRARLGDAGKCVLTPVEEWKSSKGNTVDDWCGGWRRRNTAEKLNPASCAGCAATRKALDRIEFMVSVRPVQGLSVVEIYQLLKDAVHEKVESKEAVNDEE